MAENGQLSRVSPLMLDALRAIETNAGYFGYARTRAALERRRLITWDEKTRLYSLTDAGRSALKGTTDAAD